MQRTQIKSSKNSKNRKSSKSRKSKSSKSRQGSKHDKQEYLAGRAGKKRSSRVRKSSVSEELFAKEGYDSSYFKEPIIGHIPRTKDEKELELAYEKFCRCRL